MNVKNVLTGIGSLLLSGAMIGALGLIAALFIYGSAWASSKLLPLFSLLTWISFGLVVICLLPLSVPRATRGYASMALFFSSYIFGATLWMEGLLLTLSIWGVGGVIIGMILGGVGIIPVAMLATLLNGFWEAFFELLVLTVMTFATRFGALSLANSLEG